MKRLISVYKKLKLLSAIFCLTCFLSTQISTINADILGGTRPFNAYNMIDVWVDPSCANSTFLDGTIVRDYQSVFAWGRLKWEYATNTRFNGFNVVSNYTPGVDIHKVTNAPMDHSDWVGECIGYIIFYDGSVQRVLPDADWDYAVCIAYKDTQDAYGYSFMERVSTATHEIGHSLKLDETVSYNGPSVMRQARQDIGPTDYDFGELSRKWPL